MPCRGPRPSSSSTRPSGDADDELLEHRAGRTPASSRPRGGEPLGGVAGLLQAQLGHRPHALRAHRRQVDRRPQGQQPLVRADVAGGLLAADVLLAGLQGQDPAALAAAIDGLADQPAGHAADELLAAGQDAQVRPAEGHRVAQRLAFGHDDVGPVLARPLEQAQADRIDGHDEQRPGPVGDLGRAPRTSSRQPKKLGCWTSTQAVWSFDRGGQRPRVDRPSRRADA